MSKTVTNATIVAVTILVLLIVILIPMIIYNAMAVRVKYMTRKNEDSKKNHPANDLPYPDDIIETVIPWYKTLTKSKESKESEENTESKENTGNIKRIAKRIGKRIVLGARGALLTEIPSTDEEDDGAKDEEYVEEEEEED